MKEFKIISAEGRMPKPLDDTMTESSGVKVDCPLFPIKHLRIREHCDNHTFEGNLTRKETEKVLAQKIGMQIIAVFGESLKDSMVNDIIVEVDVYEKGELK